MKLLAWLTLSVSLTCFRTFLSELLFDRTSDVSEHYVRNDWVSYFNIFSELFYLYSFSVAQSLNIQIILTSCSGPHVKYFDRIWSNNSLLASSCNILRLSMQPRRPRRVCLCHVKAQICYKSNFFKISFFFFFLFSFNLKVVSAETET